MGPTVSTTDVGNRAESAAARFLERQGFIILARNWRNRWCEIDIIAERGGTICFVEVKYRVVSSHGDGLEHITASKIRQLERGAVMWMANRAADEPIALIGVAVSGTEYIVQAATVLT
ncbi:MAG: putative Ribonuclease [Candidatus Saccharibacteria bacterium]|nr:putative Ribonuclease [Candidatus Saccharibacteria bacterium]